MANKPNPEIDMVISSYKGILSDPIPLQTPSLISNDLRLQDILISSIAPKKPVLKEVVTKSYEAVISYIKNMKNGLISLINATNNKAVQIQYQKEINTLDKILKEFKEL